MQEADTHFSTFAQKARFQLEQNSFRYHEVGCWIAILLNPIFSLTDYFNLPNHWQELLYIRLFLSLITFIAVFFQKQLRLSSSALIAIPLVGISLQNAYAYQIIEVKDILGQHLNYMALLIGASLFILWRWYYSLVFVVVSALATATFVYHNEAIGYQAFFIHGGLLLLATGTFMIILIHTRYGLILKTIRAQLELEESQRRIQTQSKEIVIINETLEKKVTERTQELERKNKILEQYAYLNSHKLRAPIASILGVIQLFRFLKLSQDEIELLGHLEKSSKELDNVVRDIAHTIADQRKQKVK